MKTWVKFQVINSSYGKTFFASSFMTAKSFQKYWGGTITNF